MASQKHVKDNSSETAEKVPASDGQVLQANQDAASITVDVEVLEESPTKAADKVEAEPVNPNPIDFEAIIADLRANLEQSRQRESYFLQQISEMKTELSDQKKLVSKLQKDKEQSHLKSELEQAKKTALELAEANSKLIEEVKAFKKEKEKEKEKQEAKPIASSRIIQKIEKLPPEKPRKPADFAETTWLLD